MARPVGDLAQVHAERATGGHGLHRVPNQVEKHLAQLDGEAVDHGRGEVALADANAAGAPVSGCALGVSLSRLLFLACSGSVDEEPGLAGVPHPPQNRLPSFTDAPHALHFRSDASLVAGGTGEGEVTKVGCTATPAGAPHIRQNRIPSGISALQARHCMRFNSLRCVKAITSAVNKRLRDYRRTLGKSAPIHSSYLGFSDDSIRVPQRHVITMTNDV